MTCVVILRPEVIDPDSGDGRVMLEHGMLWVIDRDIGGDPTDVLRWYKAVATGHKHMWFDHEIEEHNHG